MEKQKSNIGGNYSGFLLHIGRCEFCKGRFTPQNPNAGMSSRDYHESCFPKVSDFTRANGLETNFQK